MKVEGRKMKKTKKVKNRRYLERLINVVDVGLFMAICAIGYVTSGLILCHFCPAFETAIVTQTIGATCGCALGMLALLLGVSMKRKRIVEFFKALGLMALFGVVYVVVAVFRGLNMPLMCLALALQMVVGVVAAIATYGCDEGMNHIRRKLLGNVVKIGGAWCCLHEVHY